MNVGRIFDAYGHLNRLADNAVSRRRYDRQLAVALVMAATEQPCEPGTASANCSGWLGTSCTCPSVSRIVPASRPRGTSLTASASGPKTSVSPLTALPSPTVMMRVSRSGKAANFCVQIGQRRIGAGRAIA